MKLGNIVALAALITALPAAAHAEGKFAIGPQGGVTLPDFHVKNSTIGGLYDNRDGWAGGIFLEFGVWAVTLRPEVNFVTKGYTVANTADVTNRYIEVPVLLKFAPLGSLPVSPFIVVGPQWSKQISEKVEPVAGVAAYTNTVTDWDISAIAGLGLAINFSEHLALELQGRYNYGFRDVDSSNTEINMRGFYLLGGISIQDAF